MSNNVLHKGMRSAITQARVLVFDCPLESEQCATPNFNTVFLRRMTPMQVRDRTLSPDMFAEFPLDMSQYVTTSSCTAKL